MKNNILKRIGCAVLAGTLLLSLVSCKDKTDVVIKDMEKETVHSLGLDFLGGKDVMPICGFYGPYAAGYSIDGQSLPNWYTDEIFSLVAETGINMFTYSSTDYQNYPDLVYKMLELGEKHNIGITVVDGLINAPNKEDPATIEEMAAQIAKYCDYPAFCGVHVVDEPGSMHYKPSDNGAKDIELFAPVFQKLKELDVWSYGNLHPLWFEKDTDGYRKMLEEYCETCSPSYLSYDHYVWDGGRTKRSFFQNMDIIREYAEKYEIPFWAFVQAGGQWNDAKLFFDSEELHPTEGQMRWSANTALAYGAKGLQYFPVLQPSHFAYAKTDRMDFQRNGIIGAAGNKTQWWYYAKSINEQIKAVDAVLMNAVNKGVIVTGKNAVADCSGLEFIMEEASWRELKEVQGNTMIGCFNYEGKTALYVVNYEEAYAQNVILQLQDTYQVDITQKGESQKVSSNVLELDLEAGEGVLIVFE